MRLAFVALVLLLTLAGCRVPPKAVQTSPMTSDYLLGAFLYADRCALCHGPNGEGMGKVGTSLSAPEFLTTVDDQFLFDATALGRPGTTMSPWKENGLTDEQITSLVRHIRRWQTTPSVQLDNRPAQGNAAKGQALYTQHCATCHGPNGLTGGDPNLTGNSIGNPVFLRQATDGFLRYAIVHGRTGTGMTPFGQARGGPLSDQDVEDIVTLMRTWPR